MRQTKKTEWNETVEANVALVVANWRRWMTEARAALRDEGNQS